MKKNKILPLTAATQLVATAESILLGERVENEHHLAGGYGRVPGNYAHLLDFETEGVITGSRFSSICLVSRPSLEKLIRDLLNEEVRAAITAATGFRYSVDYFVFNENRHIPIDSQGGEHYANFWHTDELFSAHCLKLFIPVDDIGITDGAMNFLCESDTRQLTKASFIRSPEIPAEFAQRVLYLTGARGDVYMVKPNICLHRAGIPALGVVRRQIMIQLNPAKVWRCRRNLHELQSQREINLPFLRKFKAAYYAL